MKIKRIIFIFLLINIINCAKRIYNLTEEEFIEVSKETKNTTIKWLMAFYPRDFDEYYKFMALIKEDVYTKYKKNKKIKFGLLEITPDNVKWFSNMFNIKSVPFIILVANNRMYYYNDNVVSEENLIKFIDENKTLNDSYPIPNKLSDFRKGFIIFTILMDYLNDYIQMLLNHYNIKYKWNKVFTYAIFIMINVFIIYLIKSCCLCCLRCLCCENDENLEKENIEKEKDEKIIEKEKKE